MESEIFNPWKFGKSSSKLSFSGSMLIFRGVHSLKLTARIAPENGWEREMIRWFGRLVSFPFGFRPIFRCELLVSGRVNVTIGGG